MFPAAEEPAYADFQGDRAVTGHESLRTRVRLADGELWQVAAAEGRRPVLVHTVPSPGADPDGQEAARSLVERLGDLRFDHTTEWPLRAALVVVDGVVRQIVVVFSHSTVDFHTAETVLRDLRLPLLRGVLPTPPGLQSLDVAARRRVSSSTVLLAATAAVLTADGGPDAFGVVTMANNRFQPEYDTAISKLNQIGLCRIDLAGRPDFAELLARTKRASLDAYRHAYYDPIALARAFAEHGYDHGSVLGRFCYVNDIRLPHDVPVGASGPDEVTLRAEQSTSTFRWLGELDRFAWRCRVQVVDAPGAVELIATVDTVHLPADRVERLLWGIEDLVVHALV